VRFWAVGGFQVAVESQGNKLIAGSEGQEEMVLKWKRVDLDQISERNSLL